MSWKTTIPTSTNAFPDWVPAERVAPTITQHNAFRRLLLRIWSPSWLRLRLVLGFVLLLLLLMFTGGFREAEWRWLHWPHLFRRRRSLVGVTQLPRKQGLKVHRPHVILNTKKGQRTWRMYLLQSCPFVTPQSCVAVPPEGRFWARKTLNKGRKRQWMQLFCLQLEASCLQLSFFTYTYVLENFIYNWSVLAEPLRRTVGKQLP